MLACVVEDDGRGHRVVWDGARITRLGRGVGASGALEPAAIARTLEGVAALADAARVHSPVTLGGVGTSALRDATNREVFVAGARAILDRFDVVSGTREAELTLRGALLGVELPGDVTVVDIGGGSTEIVRGCGTRVDHARSVDVGSVRLSERHGIGDARATPEQIDAIRRDIAGALAGVTVGVPLVMVAGTATNLAAHALGIDLARGAAAPHGLHVPADALRAAIARVVAADRAARAAMVGIEPGREDVIVAGALIAEAVLDASGATEVVVSDGGVRFGLALDLLDALRRSADAC